MVNSTQQDLSTADIGYELGQIHKAHFCTHCGYEFIDEVDNFCRECGTKRVFVLSALELDGKIYEITNEDELEDLLLISYRLGQDALDKAVGFANYWGYDVDMNLHVHDRFAVRGGVDEDDSVDDGAGIADVTDGDSAAMVEKSVSAN